MLDNQVVMIFELTEKFESSQNSFKEALKDIIFNIQRLEERMKQVIIE